MLRRSLAAFACVLACVLAGAPARAKGPQASPAPQGAQTPEVVRVAAISPWTDATHPFRLAVQVLNPSEIALDRVVVRATFYPRVGSRSELRLALDRGVTAQPLGSVAQQVDAVAPGGQRVVTVEKVARDISPAFGRTGVFPVRITVTHSTGSTSQWSAVPNFASAPQRRLNVTWVLPASRPSALRPDGVYTADGIEALRLDELAQQMTVLAARPRPSITFAPSPSLLDTLADLADGFAVHGPAGIETRTDSTPEVRQATAALAGARAVAASAGEIASAPYAPIDFPSLATHGMRTDFLRQITSGRSVVESRLARAPSLATLVPGTFTADTRSGAALATLGVTGLILDPATVPQPDGAPFQPQMFGPSRPITVRARAARFGALLPDAPLRARLDGDQAGVPLAQAIIAETASAWLEIPLYSSGRVIVLASSHLPDPPALTAALDGLETAPWIRMRTASDARAALSPPAQAVALPDLAPPDRSFLRRARVARRALLTLTSLAEGTAPQAAAFDRLVLTSESAEWERAPHTGAALASAVVTGVADVVRHVRVAPGRFVTLTSKTGDVPVTLLNSNQFPVRVRVRLRSPKVAFPEGDSHVITLDKRNTTLDFSVNVLATGSFPIDVVVSTPNGARILARGRVTVRSTVVSKVALLTVGIGLAVLLLAWGGGKRRRDARSVTPGAPAR